MRCPLDMDLAPGISVTLYTYLLLESEPLLTPVP